MLTAKNILLVHCGHYENTLNAKHPDKLIHSCTLDLSHGYSEIPAYTEVRATVNVDHVSVYKHSEVFPVLVDNGEILNTASELLSAYYEKVCTRIVYNMLEYGLMAAHNDLKRLT